MSSDVEITAFKASHLDEALSLSQAAGWAHQREDWEMLYQLSTGYVVRSGTRVVGTGFRTDFGLGLSTLNMIIMAQDMRGQGLGRRLMSSLMQPADDKTYRLISTRMGRPLYERLGFAEVGQLITLRGPVGNVPKTGSAEDAKDEDRGSLIRLETNSFGGDRAAFMDWLWMHTKIAVMRKHGEVTGYAALRRFAKGYVIGPVVSSSTEDAKSLISHLAKDIEGRVLCLDVTTTSALGPRLQTLGLDHVDAPPIMQLGHLPLNDNRQAMFSQALG